MVIDTDGPGLLWVPVSVWHVCWTGTKPTRRVHDKGGATTPCAVLLSPFLESIDIVATEQYENDSQGQLLWVEGWWQWQQIKGVPAQCTKHEVVGSQPHTPPASFQCTLVAGEDTGRSMQDKHGF